MDLTKRDCAMLAALGALGAFIWARDLRWQAAADDTLPILAALPLFYWLGRPWVRSNSQPARLAPQPALLAAILFPLGIVVDSGLVLAAGWTALLWSSLSAPSGKGADAFKKKLLVLPMLSFPWLVTDFETVGWWFRLSGAAVTAQLLTLFHVPVVREGTLLWCNQLAISVEPACSGVNGLQSMLVVGSALLYLKLRSSPLYWWNLPVLAGVAWLAHVFRIMTAALCGVIFSPEAAARWVGPIHAFTGWLGLVAGFALCYGWFSLQARWLARSAGSSWRARWALIPWGYLAVTAYAAWCARGLPASWWWAPYDRLSWLAFLIWLAPLCWFGGLDRVDSSARWRGCLWLACALFLIGAAADINAIYHAALAIMLAGFYRRRGAWLSWAVGSLAWMPAAGWIGSRLGIQPAAFGFCRIAVAVASAAVGLSWLWRARATTEVGPRLQPRSVLMRGEPRHAD
jgi:exosortase/archaeosortase family protein